MKLKYKTVFLATSMLIMVFLISLNENVLGQNSLVDVGGYKLQYLDKGKGSPAVVFLNGGIAKMDYWEGITSEISKYTRVITYERAGHQKSEMGIEPRHGKNIAAELKVLLEKLEVSEPYIVVAHSAGCMYARIFLSEYPEAVFGSVLLDPGDKDFLDEFGEKYLKGENKKNWEGFWSRTWARLMDRTDGFGKEIQMKEKTIKQMLSGKFAPDLRLHVFSGVDESRPSYYLKEYDEGIRSKFYKYAQDYHKSLIKGLTNAKHIPLNDASHVIHIDRPDAVIASIKEMIKLFKAE